MRSLGHPVPEDELRSMIREVDSDGDGFIDLREFIELNTTNVDEAQENLRHAFDIFDADKSGAISAEELLNVLRSLGEECTLDDSRKMISGVDIDGSGTIDFEEFKAMMMKGGRFDLSNCYKRFSLFSYFLAKVKGSERRLSCRGIEGETAMDQRSLNRKRALSPSQKLSCCSTMAVGKNKRISKGKKGGKKKAVDPFAKKEWYDIKAPSVFSNKNVGKTLITRTQGTKIASEGLKHRVIEASLADLQGDEDHAYRKIRLRIEDVQGKNVLTNFWGMDFTTDKLRSLVRKRQSLIEAHIDVKTTDAYTLRMFCIAFTKKRVNQQKVTCYAKGSQVRQIRRKMREIMVNQAQSCSLKELVLKFIPESIGKEIEKATSSIYPLQNVYIRKVKILKAPKFDLGKLMEVHGDYTEDIGAKLDRPADEPVAEPTELVDLLTGRALSPSQKLSCCSTMAVGKNKRISKGKKGGKKKAVDPFAKKEWYDIKAPSVFSNKNVGKTLITRTQGTKIASEGLKHRVIEASLADLQGDEDHAYRKIRLRIEDVQGKNVLTNFWGMDFTTDKLRSLVRKRQSLIEAHIDVKTTDAYTLRMFCIAFTKKRVNQQKVTCYAKGSQVRQIRRKMREIMVNQAQSCSLKELVLKFIPESIGKEIEKATSSIYPLQNVYIRKVKILKAPKFDLGKLMEVHGDYTEDIGAKLDRPAEEPVAEPTELVGA
ncbi:hypothetical protein SASPL_130723 [Salvia splendens]|uniref:Small ribosomal subunit protein eS1 n=2 Tax=Salvia splendens TaxID=180675 RepID=A0A8X8ZK78_SALSN|nr:hypothetical protein SASPL_130723 [Salvia splendens]